VTDSHTATKACEHNPFAVSNTLIIESNWAAGTRIRCTVCSGCSEINHKGQVKPQTCACHAAPEALADETTP